MDTVRILDILDEREATFIRCAGGDIGKCLNAVKSFVRSDGRNVPNINNWRKDAATCFTHGDFHAKNILIKKARNRGVVTIDFPKMDQRHCILDLAHLEVDIVLSGMDCREGVDTQWPSLESWNWCIETVACEDVFACLTDARDIFQVAVASLREAVRILCPDACSEEYLLGVLHFCLKMICYPDISLPKKALALRYAATILERFGDSA